ncbi:MAG: amidohydrolase [Candidatus Pacebacteria bacterium]|nr:amidohydrolase [Candidatus Paceibacterota bacterium]
MARGKNIKINFPLINTHTHAAMTAFRGMAEDLPLKDWLEKYIWPAEKEKVRPEFVYKNTKEAIQEMKRNGIKVFNDMYFFSEEVARAAEEEKIMAVVGEVILDFPTNSAETPEEALQKTEKLILKYKNNPFISVAAAPHSIYALSEKWLVEAKNLARKYGVLYHIHLSETKKEFDDCAAKTGLTPVGYMNKLGLLDDKTILAHCVWLADEDMDILSKTKANVSHCPLSNLKLGSGIAPISKMLEKGVNICLGTDGAASSNRLDIWEAGKFAALLQKGITNDPSKISAKDVMEMMSVNGLKALGISEFEGKGVAEMKNEIENSGDFSQLYELGSGEIDFH